MFAELLNEIKGIKYTPKLDFNVNIMLKDRINIRKYSV